MRLQACNTVFFFFLPVGECLAAAEGRVGKPREDMPWMETEFDAEFRQYILDFPQQELPFIFEQMDNGSHGSI